LEELVSVGDDIMDGHLLKPRVWKRKQETRYKKSGGTNVPESCCLFYLV